MAAVIMVVVPINGPIIVDHIAKLNCGFCLVEQGIRSTPVHLEPWYPPLFFLVIVTSVELT